MINCSSNYLNPTNFVKRGSYFIVVHPNNNGITRISKPAEKYMPWCHAMAPQSGWRLPTIEELKIIRQIYIILKPYYKDLIVTERVWSSDQDPNNNLKALFLNFDSGQSASEDKNLPLEVIYVYP